MSKRNGGRLIRVLVVAASAVRRAGLEALVKNNPEFKLLGSLPNIATIAQHTGELQIDVVLLDLQHPAPAVDVGVPLIALIDAPHASGVPKRCDPGIRRFSLANQAWKISCRLSGQHMPVSCCWIRR